MQIQPTWLKDNSGKKSNKWGFITHLSYRIEGYPIMKRGGFFFFFSFFLLSQDACRGQRDGGGHAGKSWSFFMEGKVKTQLLLVCSSLFWACWFEDRVMGLGWCAWSEIQCENLIAYFRIIAPNILKYDISHQVYKSCLERNVFSNQCKKS